MRRPTAISDADGDGAQAGIYDPAPAGDDLWFLPAPDEPDDDRFSPVSSRATLLDAAGWRAAEAGLAADLAALAFDLGRLAAQVAKAGPGALQRLALAEAASLSWWTGARITADRLALWQAYRIGAVDDDGDGLLRTAWAARRLAAAPTSGPMATTLAAHLGDDGRGDGALLAEVADLMGGIADLSPITQGCALFHLWRALDDRPDHLRGLEAAVLGARLASRIATTAAAEAGLSFVPLTLTGLGGVVASGAPSQRLRAWVTGAHAAVLAALLAGARIDDWQHRATARTTDLSGRTPARLIAALAAHPMLAMPQAAAETGASRAAVQRNLDILQARGLVREVTGQGRFRVWAALPQG